MIQFSWLQNLVTRHFGLVDTVFCCSDGTAAAADYFSAVRTDGARNATFSHFPHDPLQSVCALHKYETFALLQHVLPPYLL